jgi:hypothetical protein
LPRKPQPRPVKLYRVKRANKNAVAKSFVSLDFHDDGFVSLKIHPPHGRSNFTSIEFELQDDSTAARKLLSFRSCANFRFVADFDVLAFNWFGGNVAAHSANTDIQKMTRFVKAQKQHWRTIYMPPTAPDKPIRRKMASLRSYVLFRVKFFGGTAEILAKNYRLKR